MSVNPDVADLPRELVSLVHHVELTKRGWWDRTLERMILVILCRRGSRSLADLGAGVSQSFQIQPTDLTLREALGRLVEAEDVLELQSGEYKISETCRTRVIDDDAAFEALEDQVRKRFGAALKAESVPLNSDLVWEDFGSILLHPLIRELGARTWELMEGRNHLVESASSLAGFLATFDEDLREGLERVVL